MKRPSPACQAKYQTTGSVFVQWIIFYDFSAINRLPYFRNPDFPQDRLVRRVLGKLKFVFQEFYPDFFNHVKAAAWIETFDRPSQLKKYTSPTEKIQTRPNEDKKRAAIPIAARHVEFHRTHLTF